MNNNIYFEDLLIGQHERDQNIELIRFYLSNSIEEIIKVIDKQVINKFLGIQKIKWEINTDRLALKIKEVMNKWDVNYSLAIFTDRKDHNIKHVSINYRTENERLFFGGVIISNEYFTYEEVGAY